MAALSETRTAAEQENRQLFRRFSPNLIWDLKPENARALGLPDLSHEAQAVATAKQRGLMAEIANWSDMRTAGGQDRSTRLRLCGARRAAFARVGDRELLGHTSRGCNDRFCPVCQRQKAREDAELLRAWYDVRLSARTCPEAMRPPDPEADSARWTVDPFAFVNLTQLKESADAESCAEALDRLFASWRGLSNAKHRKRHRVWRRYVRGGIRVVETAYSERGTTNKDGSRVKYSGWHPHIHAIVELTTPPVGVSWAEWRREFEAWLVAEWMELSPGAKRGGQYVTTVDRHRVGQLCKYVLKPFAMGSERPELLAEAMRALGGRQTMGSFGDWHGWQKAVRKPKAKGPEVFTATTILDTSFWREQHTEDHLVVFEDGAGKVTNSKPWTVVKATIKADPRSLWQKIRDQESGERDEAKDRIAWMESHGTTDQAPGLSHGDRDQRAGGVGSATGTG